MFNVYGELSQTWSAEDSIFSVTLCASILVILYAMTLIHRKMRIIENELQALRKDHSVISEELELLANLKEAKKA